MADENMVNASLRSAHLLAFYFLSDNGKPMCDIIDSSVGELLSILQKQGFDEEVIDQVVQMSDIQHLLAISTRSTSLVG